MRAVQSESQRAALDRLLVLGTLLEGHADHVMDAVGPAVVPTVATIRMVLEKDPEPPTRRHPEIPRDLETICLKCLEKDPMRRYASAEALAEDLDRWANGEPISARPVSPTERSVKWVRRHPAYAGLGLALVLSLTAVAVVSNVARARVSRALDIARSQKAEIERTQGTSCPNSKPPLLRWHRSSCCRT